MVLQATLVKTSRVYLKPNNSLQSVICIVEIVIVETIRFNHLRIQLLDLIMGEILLLQQSGLRKRYVAVFVAVLIGSIWICTALKPKTQQPTRERKKRKTHQ